MREPHGGATIQNKIYYLGLSLNGYRVFPHRLSGKSAIETHTHRAQPVCFQRHRSGNGRARSIVRSAFLSPKEYRDFAAQCLRWAARAKREEHKNMMLQMAHRWMQTAQKLERADTYRCVPSGARLVSTPTPQDDARQKPSQDDFKGVDDIFLAGPTHDTRAEPDIERVCHGLFRSRAASTARPKRSAA